ncbi:MAG: hypothetical protein GC139_08450 [Sideroxydans sp.]|nr:hypothetical protein [Sideroxydans sp.]
MNAHVHLVVPDLFLPRALAAEVCAGLHLPALEKILARGQAAALSAGTLESWLCEAFGVAGEAIAPITLHVDGMEPGPFYWLRADPVYLRIHRDQLVLQPVAPVAADEAAQLCAALNGHFAADGLHFIAPQPQRWYLRLERAPQISSYSLAQVAGKDVHAHMPQGVEALRWHGVLNEIQMLLFEHPVNLAREVRGEWEVNSVWLWGGGYAGATLRQPCGRVYTDSPLAAAFAAAAGIDQAALPDAGMQWTAGSRGETLIVWDGLRSALQYGDLGRWRDSLQQFEQRCTYPLLQALHDGRIEKITLDVPQENAARRFVLTRLASWKLWRRVRRLDSYSLV